MLEIDVEANFALLVGGDARAFFSRTWRRRVLLTRDAWPELRGAYGFEAFLEDYRRADFHQATLLATAEGQRRVMRRPSSTEEMELALSQGMSAVLQALLVRDRVAPLPQAWRRLLSFYDQLRSFLLPGFPVTRPTDRPVSALDVFCTTSGATTGGHYDSGDVFYLVLEGEKEWTIETTPDPATAYSLMAEGTGYAQDRPPLREHQVMMVRPGDCLYVPPFTYHRVRSSGRSLAVSFGLPAFTEVTLLTTFLQDLQRGSPSLFEPLPTFPRALPDLASAAAGEVHARTAQLLSRLHERMPPSR